MAQSVDASAQLANLELLSKNDPAVYAALLGEEARERSGIELIPSENYAFPEVLAVLGSVFTNKYSEGYPGRRYYGGQTYTDEIENLARDRAKEVFRCEHANVQPLSGSGMNQAVYLGCSNQATPSWPWICPMGGTSPTVRPCPIWGGCLTSSDT